MKLSEMEARLSAFVTSEFGSNSHLTHVEESDGHAGLTYLFEVATQSEKVPFVIKIPPSGVRLRNNTDVLRQAPLLNALANAGLPAPKVPYHFEDNDWFDRPFIIMERLPGRVFFVWEPHRSFDLSTESVTRVWRQCVEQLAPLHLFDWQSKLQDWEEPESLINNVKRWRKIYNHALEISWIELAEHIEDKLLAHLPHEYRVGLFHGDFQPGNLLYDQGDFTGIIDWELSGISAQLLDLGWLLMVCDPSNFIDEYRPVGAPHPNEVLRIYQQGMGETFDDVPWFQAFAGFRLASIACLNHKLHVTGKRPEPAWIQLGKCVPLMYERADQLLAEYQ